MLIARTDARGAHGGSLDEAIRRANAYLEAGADMAFVEGPTSVDEVRRICKEVHGPDLLQPDRRLAAASPWREMNELGIAVTILPGRRRCAPPSRPCTTSPVTCASAGPRPRSTSTSRFKAHPLGNLHTFAGFDQVRAWEEAYLPAEELDKYADSVGHQPHAG